MPAAYSDHSRLSYTNLSRNDSLKSERSDKRVSFNKDVGVKHIPRGLKRQAPQPPKQDEWGNYASVHREPPPISSTELEKQAEDLVRLLDQVDCVATPNSNKNSQFSSRSLDRANNKTNNKRLTNLKNNTILNLARRNNLKNGDKSSDKSSTTSEAKTRQSLINSGRNKITNNKDRKERKSRPVRRSHSTHSYVNDINSSDTDYNYEKDSRFKSEPDIQRAINISQNTPKRHPYRSVNNLTNNKSGPMSVDNIYKDNILYPSPYRRHRNSRNEYKSADNLTDVSIPGNRELHEFKSAENLQSGYSSSDIDASYGNFNKSSKKMDQNDIQLARSHKIMYEDTSSPRGLKSPNQYYGHNKNKPFSYTGGSLSSIEEVKRLSPSRELPRYGEDQYAKINKNVKISTMPSLNEKELNHKNDDYSAKIIIKSQPIRNRYDDDDNAYETYQVKDGNLTKQIRDLGISSHIKNDYKKISNNNINMSSIGVQTEKVPKAPNRQRRQYRSPIRNGYSDDNTKKKALSSASLVRQVSHEFGRMERSPSPPKVVASHRKSQRTVIPLLSDTDDSERNYRRNIDPLAKIRDQVKIREKLQEEKENEEREQINGRYYSNRPTEYNESTLQPLTIDEVDALEFEVDLKGRNSLVVAREGYPSNAKKYLNERSHIKKTENSDQNISYTLKDRNISYQNTDKESDNINEKSSSKFFSTLERIKKGAAEKSKNILDRKDPKMKDKKKKRIKIKFFYDPRPQDTNAEDPLSRYTEYKGSSSDDLTTRNNREYQSNISHEYKNGQGKPLIETRSRSREATLDRRQHYDSSSDKRDYSSSPSRPPRYSSVERIIGRDHSRNRNERESSSEQPMNRTNNRMHTDEKSYSYGYDPSYKIRTERKYGADYDKKDSNSTNRILEYQGVRQERRDLAHNADVNIPYNRYGSNEIRKTPEKNIALSEKYKNLTRNSSPPREIYVLNGKSKTYKDDSVHTEDEEKLGRIQRQRKKFFGVLRGEGRTKPITKTSFIKENDQTSSNTLSKTRGREENEVEAARIIEKVKEQTYRNQQQRKKSWPWSIINIRGNKNNKLVKNRRTLRHTRPVSRASSKASSRSGSRIINKPARPSIRAVRIRNDSYNDRSHISRDRYADDMEKRQWENATINKSNVRSRSNDGKSKQYFVDSSSSVGTPVNTQTKRSNSRQRYFGDTDSENRTVDNGRGDYRSLPNRKARSSTSNSRFVMGARRNFGGRGVSPGARGSAGSSLQSSESEADSHGGSHASRASHISTGSNRSVYLHATAVADIPVRRSSDDSPSEKGINRQTKRVSRSFSLASPWKPRHYRDRFEVEYDNREIREARPGRQKSALPPRPPRKTIDHNDSKKVGRSQTVYKDSRLAGWLRKKKNKEQGKGI